ncbi:MAG TPA: response regulator transcription factor [Actinophytocola sp.]|uniref:response regulator transcription factor n=1 Tax=Actinophytocola sp. TaxID=1872138 RepID=UPI002DB73561|nr:response regulator transcription factor [Actinophytocola sp.]HEU5475956.1 response regulator transcription factor [Actinophytocola sp.]
MEGTNSVTVVLQHQNRLVREMLAGHLVREPGIVLAGTAPSGPELIQLCNLRKPAVALFEADTPRWSNERLVSLLAQAGRDMRLVGVHDALPTAYVIRAYDSGVSALVSYTSGLEALLDAVKNPLLPVEAARAKRVDGHTLTERELQVLYLISAGYPPKQVASELGISLHTVENHKQRIFAKLDVHNQAHAAASAVRLGLLPRAVPAPRQQPKLPRRRRRIHVVLRDPAGRLSGRIREVLDEQNITVLQDDPENRPSAGSDHEVVITMLVDPSQEDWPEPDGRRTDLVVIVTSREPKRSDVTKALSGGIATVPASRIDDLLAPAVRATANGYIMVNSTYVRALLGPAHAGANGGWQRWELALTPREREILTSIGRGHATKQTARMLGISIRTVENLQSNLFRKLRVHSRAAALVAAHDLGLLDE